MNSKLQFKKKKIDTDEAIVRTIIDSNVQVYEQTLYANDRETHLHHTKQFELIEKPSATTGIGLFQLINIRAQTFV